MPNGSSALQLLDLPAAPAFTTAQEIEIGRRAAAAVMALAMGVIDYKEAGELTDTSKVWSGAMLGHLTQLMLDTIGDHPRDEFHRLAREEGKRALHARPDGVILARLAPRCQVDAVIDELFGHALAIAEKVAASELALRAN